MHQFLRVTYLKIGVLTSIGFAPLSLASGQPRVYKLDLSYAKIVHNNDPLLPDVPTQDWGQQVELSLGIRTPYHFFLEPTVHFETAYQKVETVGLYFRTGFNLTDWLDVEWQHHSRHSADRTNSYAPNDSTSSKYPLLDTVGFRVHFIP